MRAIRMLLGSLVVTAAVVVGTGHGVALANAAGVWVQVSPSTIEAGNSVTVRADCGDNSNSATVSSMAFNSMRLEPWNTLLQGEATIGHGVKPATYDVKLTCRTGSSATTTLTVLSSAATVPTRGPHTGGGFLANGSATEDSSAARIWLVGGLTALIATGAFGFVTLHRNLRRRRRAPVRTR